MSDIIKYYKDEQFKLIEAIDKVNKDINFLEIDLVESKLDIEQYKWLRKILNAELLRVQKALALKGGELDEHIETVPNT